MRQQRQKVEELKHKLLNEMNRQKQRLLDNVEDKKQGVLARLEDAKKDAEAAVNQQLRAGASARSTAAQHEPDDVHASGVRLLEDQLKEHGIGSLEELQAMPLAEVEAAAAGVRSLTERPAPPAA